LRLIPSVAARRSWELRPEALRAKTLAALLAKADRKKGNAVMAELCRDPQFLLERTISRLRAEAIENGMPPPQYYRVEVYDKPVKVRYPGRSRRKRRVRAAPTLSIQSPP
jgi:hypothetical protein